jgi:hypothetical protein
MIGYENYQQTEEKYLPRMFCYQVGSFGDGFNTHFVRTDSENGSYSRIGKKHMRQNGQTRLIVLCLFISFCTLVRIITRRKGLEHITDVPDLSELRSPILILRTLNGRILV